MVAIPILCRDYSRRALVTELVVILVANSIMIVFLYTTLPHFINTKPDGNRRNPESIAPGHLPAKR
jgi:hypothetical protein